MTLVKFKNLLPAIVALTIMVPVLSILTIGFKFDQAAWSELLGFQRLRSFAQTVILSAGVGLLVAILGTGLAWLVTAYQFRSRQILKFALLLPMAIPTYIMAYSYLDLLHPLGPIQTLIRSTLDISSPKDLKLPDIRNIFAAILLLGFVLFPYVYISSKAMFLTIPANLIESARILGASSKSVFWRLALPHARPGIAAGVGIALLEVVNDVGASEFLGVRTATVELYVTWISKGDLTSAARIALMLVLMMLIVSLIEKLSRHRIKYSQPKNSHPMQPKPLRGLKGSVIVALGWVPVLLGFVLPAGYLLHQVIQRASHQPIFSRELLAAAAFSFKISMIVTLIVIIIATVVVWLMTRFKQRTDRNHPNNLILNSTKIGYFLPGTVLAIGLLSPYSFLDSFFKQIAHFFEIRNANLVMLGTSAGIVTACTIRFLGMAVSNIEAGYGRISIRLDQAARTLGRSATSILALIHIPMLRPALLSAALLVFVETMKELPTTLLLRPIGTETLATLLYADASRGSYEDGATAALLIVLIGILPLIYLTRLQQVRQLKS